MVKFVVVDDDKEEILHIEKLLDEIVEEDKMVLTFTKVNTELKDEIKNIDTHKVYILDIELGSVSGITIARLIRSVDWDSEIIFITNHDKMFESVHRSVYEVFDFIEKFHEFDKRFKKDIKEILKRKLDNKMFTYKSSNNIDLCIYYKYIQYICVEDRKLIIYADHGNKYTINLNLKDIGKYLDSRFVQCHKSCIVNKDRIQEKNFKEGYFKLDTGEKVYMLSKKYRKDLEND